MQPKVTCCVRRTYDRLWKEAMEELVDLAREEDPFESKTRKVKEQLGGARLSQACLFSLAAMIVLLIPSNDNIH
jgi:hypothetical protein